MILDVDRAFLVTDDLEGIQLTHQEADVLAALAFNRGLSAFDVLIAVVWAVYAACLAWCVGVWWLVWWLVALCLSG